MTGSESPGDTPVYTLDEAQALVPQLRAVLLQLAIQKRRFDAALEALHAVHGNGGGEHAESDRREAQLADVGESIRSLIRLLEELGVQVRDLDDGLVDIPAERDGERVWLCWRLADEAVAYWHSTREGFSSRKPW